MIGSIWSDTRPENRGAISAVPFSQREVERVLGSDDHQGWEQALSRPAYVPRALVPEEHLACLRMAGDEITTVRGDLAILPEEGAPLADLLVPRGDFSPEMASELIGDPRSFLAYFRTNDMVPFLNASGLLTFDEHTFDETTRLRDGLCKWAAIEVARSFMSDRENVERFKSAIAPVQERTLSLLEEWGLPPEFMPMAKWNLQQRSSAMEFVGSAELFAKPKVLLRLFRFFMSPGDARIGFFEDDMRFSILYAVRRLNLLREAMGLDPLPSGLSFLPI